MHSMQALSLPFESLESRLLLSVDMAGTGEIQVDSTAVYAPLDFFITAAASPVPVYLQDRVSPNLWTALKGQKSSAGELARFSPEGDVEVTVSLASENSMQEVLAVLKSLGVKVGSSAPDVGAFDVWLPSELLEKVAAMPAIKFMDLPSYATYNTGVVNSEGDGLLRANLARSNFGLSGAGVRIGVISDGVDGRTSVGTDLPTITVNPSAPGSGNEGTAMLEIIHDLAPNAQLFFSAAGTVTGFASAITYLRNQQVDIIVDDVTYFAEPYFQDGAAAAAVQNAVNAGVAYVTSAGNSSTPANQYGRSHYQSVFQRNAYNQHDFGPGISYKTLRVDSGATLAGYLQWSDPWGASANNYDLSLFSSQSVLLAQSAVTAKWFSKSIRAY